MNMVAGTAISCVVTHDEGGGGGTVMPGWEKCEAGGGGGTRKNTLE
jgi:hypothetical protein